MTGNSRTAIIGAGLMGGGLARGFINARVLAAHQMVLYDMNPLASDQLAHELGEGAQVAKSAADAAADADTVLIAVKPHVVLALLPTLNLRPTQLLISIAAGVTLHQLEYASGAAVPVLRVMPNTPASIGFGAAALSCGKWVKADHLNTAEALFGAVGKTVVVEERLMDAVTGLSGSGPAFVYLFIEALIDGGVKMGLPRAVARTLAVQTVRGASEMLSVSDEHPAQLKDNVTTPGGTTITGLAVLERAGLRSALIDAVEAAAQRSQELSS